MNRTDAFAPDPDELNRWLESEFERYDISGQSGRHFFTKRTNLFNVRQTRGITQSNLAAKVHSTQHGISIIENGRREPSVYLALMIAQALEVPVEDLFSLQHVRADAYMDTWVAVKD